MLIRHSFLFLNDVQNVLPYINFSIRRTPTINLSKKCNNYWKTYTNRKLILNTKCQYRKNVSNKLVQNEILPLKIKLLIGLTSGSALQIATIKFSCCKEVRTYQVQNETSETKFDLVKFWSYLKPQLLWFIAAITSALIVAIINIQIPQIMSDVINILVKSVNKFDTNTFFNQLKPTAVRLFTMYIVQSTFTFAYIFLLAEIGENIALKMKNDLFKSIIAQDIAFFDTHRTGEIVNRLTSDVQDFKSSFKQTVSGGLRAITQIVGSGISLMFISPQMTTVTLLTIPTVILIGSGFGAILRKISRNAQAQTEKTTTIAEEAISNIRTVRGFAMEDIEMAMFQNELELVKQLNISLGVGIGLFQAGTNLFLNSIVLSTLTMGGYLLSTNQLTAGQLMAFLMATQTIQRSLAQMSLLFGSVVRGMAAGSRVFEYINLTPTLSLKGGIKLEPNTITGSIEFKNVTFKYPSRPDQIILDEFNLSIKPGQTVALVGGSGNGKSTVVALLQRLYDVNAGSIYVDGYDLRQLDPTWFRQQVIGIVSQEPILFACSIRDNIRYANTDATNEQIEEAAKLANAHDFIINFPNGYDTVVGERGCTLSGGQKQRIAIARALIKNPSILILDEATSALDSEGEKLVKKALDNASVGRTCLVIAHRLSTIQNADLIVVLNKGRIVEIGTSKELIAKRGIYWTYVLQQSQSE